VVANLHWTAKQPGTALRSKILPAFVAGGLFCFVVSGIIVRRGRRALEAVQFSENRARHLATHDLLTGLPNRRALEVHLEQVLAEHSSVWLLYMDLDGFKETNDLYGHGAGDGLLKAVAARLKDTVPAEHMLARVGGDEFALAMVSEDADADAVACSLITAFASAFHVGDYSVSLGVSIGLSKSDQTADADELVRRADSSMYAAKAQGKHCFQIYTPALDACREARKQLETDLRSALERDEIGLVYQPIVCARSQKVVCVEALARWLHPTRGLIPPDQFIPIAESSGLIVDLGRAILTKGCREARAWGVDLAVNLSPAQFWDRGLAATIVEVLNATAFPPERLELEITEGYLMRRPEAAGRILEQLKTLGVRIALDDFGTGFASIGYLQQLGFDSIKIDRSFIVSSAADKQAAELASAIIAIGDALNLPVTAEGVETEEQAKIMRKSGCSRLQGWFFGKPIPQAEMTEWFDNQSRQAS
jgi:diguanylate cyclase (GGDEF)-like protein